MINVKASSKVYMYSAFFANYIPTQTKTNSMFITYIHFHWHKKGVQAMKLNPMLLFEWL